MVRFYQIVSYHFQRQVPLGVHFCVAGIYIVLRPGVQVMSDESDRDDQRIVDDLEQWLEENPSDASAAYKLALVLIEMGRFEDALVWAEQCAVLAPNDASALKVLGMARDYNSMFDEAQRILEHATDLDPNDADAWLCLGMHYFQPPLRNAQEALKHFSKACLVDAGNSQAQQARAEALERLGRLEEARTAYLEAIKADHDNLPAIKMLALVENQLGRLERAADLLRIYVSRAPDDLDAIWTLERIIYKSEHGDDTDPPD